MPEVKGAADPLSILANAVMPKYAGQVAEQVAKTRAREEQFAADLQSTRSSYGSTDSAGQGQIDAAAGALDPADRFGAGSPAEASPSPPGSDGAASQLSQMMGIAMQVGQQALQMPMQAVGMAGQMVQPVVQGVQGIVQQATQASEKSGEGAKGDDAENGAEAGSPAADRQSESATEKPEDKKDDQKSEQDERSDKDKKDESGAGAEAGHGPQAPVGAPQVEPSHPGQAPRHRQMTETSPEVAL
ncbi:hypothetical protein [Mycolicibacterium sp. HK-90]|uniref:hypothetical protein n=1 Tax=Mycolicibacterium sp. HK-90 TaxID=3056937 RepID=UPI002657D277|nr:hypothetical protein [Mycolicibacterium sp. HK-90]WKG03641.1 hypothetical protein QU592_00360 [Mycolicibacterium sp. HK-90]